MYVLNPTKEEVQRSCKGTMYTFPTGKVVEVPDTYGPFLVEAREEPVVIPQGAYTWHGLMPITAADEVDEIAKTGIASWVRKLEYRIQVIEAQINELLDPNKPEPLEAKKLRRSETLVTARLHLDWAERVLAGEERWVSAKSDVPKIDPPAKPKGVEFAESRV